ncbi:hypothetical protein GF362_03635 [Candidatus Dojkabacteria bacterium]|nr:hypothetical protein [Candidatus Dojkabacteria bacterium]
MKVKIKYILISIFVLILFVSSGIIMVGNIQKKRKSIPKQERSITRGDILNDIETKLAELRNEEEKEIPFVPSKSQPYQEYLVKTYKNFQINMDKFEGVPESDEILYIQSYDIFKQGMPKDQLVRIESEVKDIISKWDFTSRSEDYMSIEEIKDRYLAKDDFLLTPKNIRLPRADLEKAYYNQKPFDQSLDENETKLYRLDLYVFPTYEGIPNLTYPSGKVILISESSESNIYYSTYYPLYQVKDTIEEDIVFETVNAASKEELNKRIKDGMIFPKHLYKPIESNPLYFKYKRQLHPILQSVDNTLDDYQTIEIQIFDAIKVIENDEYHLLLRSEVYRDGEFYSWIPFLVDIKDWGTQNLTYSDSE